MHQGQQLVLHLCRVRPDAGTGSTEMSRPDATPGREGALHDDARCPAFGDLLHGFPIVGTVDRMQDLRQETRPETVTVIFALYEQ